MKPVKQIDVFTLKIVETYTSISEAATVLGINPSLIHRACNNPTLTAGGYLFRYVNGAPKIARKINHPNQQKTVRQFDPKTGELIATYCSIADAARATGASSTGITMTCKGRRNQAGGYFWNYITDNNPPKTLSTTSKPSQPRPVEQLDPTTNAVVAKYGSISDAAAMVSGATVSNIIESCQGGRHKTSGGFKWRYSSDK